MKRFFDLVTSFLLLVIFSPLIAVVAALIRFQLGSPVFFRQKRPGLHGRLFEMIKFRTMREAFDENGKALPDEVRMTSLGRTLRATSIDELPELINVLRGEMSLVGPRPLLEKYLPLYTSDQARRHDVLPGITGLAQVSGRNAISWEEKFDLDVWYVEHRSLLLDAKILWRTMITVVSRKGVSSAQHVTSPEFLGGSRVDVQA